MTDAAAPSCFVSYSWEDAAHKSWVRQLAHDLRRNGIDAWLDADRVRPGASFTSFMETAVSTCDYVLCICTPEFAAKANGRQGGVGYEAQIVSAHLARQSDSAKFIPVLRAGQLDSAIPSYLVGRHY